jgi:hypothetical protein
MLRRRCRAIGNHYTDRGNRRVDLTQVFHMELFLRYDENISAGRTGELAYVTLHGFYGQSAGKHVLPETAVGKRTHSTAMKVFFRTHELP